MNHILAPDDLAQQDLLDWLASSPAQALIEIDRALVARDGLRAFCRLAWPTIEGSEDSYSHNWHIDAICEHLEAVSKGEIRRLAIAIPPRHMKSLLTAVMWPAFDWISRPECRFLFASYAYDLAVRDSVKCRRIIQSPWYQDRWGDKFKLVSDNNLKEKFENNQAGYRLCASVDSKVTGEGGDIVVVDDAHLVKEAESEAKRLGTLRWWDETMSSRLNNPKKGAFVIIGQRVHENDLTGHVLKKKARITYVYLCLPARFEANHPNKWERDPRRVDGELIWPGHVGENELSDLENDLGAYAAAGQLQQRPAPREGGLFKRSYFDFIAVEPADVQWSRAWDLAATEKKLIKSDPDWTATARVGFSPRLKKFVIAHVARWREDAGEIRRIIEQTARADGLYTKITLPQDPGQAGKDQAQEYARMLSAYQIEIKPPTGDKVVRASPLLGQASSGNVLLVKADWNETFLDEITGFPTGAHDDQVDAASDAYNRIAGGTMGIMEYYRQMLEGQAEKEAPPDARDGQKTVEEQTSDMGRAFGRFLGM